MALHFSKEEFSKRKKDVLKSNFKNWFGVCTDYPIALSKKNDK